MPTDPPATLTRKPGAPAGNKNRYLHGRYTCRPDPPSDLEPSSPPNRLTLSQEIAYLRAYMHRTAMIGALTGDLDHTQEALRTLSLAATALTRLVHTENWLSQASGIHVQCDELPAILARMDSFSNKVLATLQPRGSRLPTAALEQVTAQVESLLAESACDPIPAPQPPAAPSGADPDPHASPHA